MLQTNELSVKNMLWPKKRRSHYCLSVVCLVLCYYVFWHSDNEVLVEPTELSQVVVHLDLKGAPPNLSYLTSILPLLKRHGANGLLVEYEGMFPFAGRLTDLRAKNAYAAPELSQFLRRADELGFDVIPLVQTFGHLQHILERKQYADLRENQNFTDSICPSQEKSKELIKEMLNQIITFHKKIIPLKFIHVGCDEVFSMNQCQYCRERKLSKLKIFLHHVRLVYDIVQTSAPGTEVLIWDDMLRGKSEELLKPMKLPVDLVCWYYHTNVRPSYVDLHKYKNNFNNVWAASAFKGADGVTSLLPNLAKRVQNHFSWMQFLDIYKGLLVQTKSHFRGIILTGWSRYNHDAPVCDLLPASLPSLIINLIVVQKFTKQPVKDVSTMTWITFYDRVQNDISKSLKCTSSIDNIESIDGDNCLFQGSDLNSALKKVEHFCGAHQFIIEAVVNEIWEKNITDYSKRKDLVMNNAKEMRRSLLQIEQNMADAMSQYFSQAVMVDYLKQMHSRVAIEIDKFEKDAFKQYNASFINK